MPRRTAADIREQGAKAADVAAAAFIRAKAAEIEAARKWQMTAAEKSMLKRRLDAIAEGIEQGLHR